MPLQRLEHCLVLTEDIETTKSFYRDALGMRVGHRPQLSFDGYWLYLGDVPCMHIAERGGYEQYARQIGVPCSGAVAGTGAIDHIAFNATDFDGMLRRLEGLGMEPSKNMLDDIGMRQLFLRDPNGVTIELNFNVAA